MDGWSLRQSGLVRIHFVRGLTRPLGHRMQLGKAEPISVLCSSWPPLQGLAFLQPAIASCPVPSHGPHRTLGMKSAENSWLRAHSHRNWGLPGQ